MTNTFISILVVAVILYILTMAYKNNNVKKMQDTTTQSVTNTDTNIVPTPVFILFAEYVGFVSDFLEWADKWCNTGKISEWKKMIMINDAANLMCEMKKKYSEEEIKEWYIALYEDFIKPNIDNYNKNNKA